MPDHVLSHTQEVHETAAAHDLEHHVISPRVYLWVFFWLMVLLVVTLVAASFHLGPLNLPIAIAIAFAKMVIIVLYFMHIKFSTLLVKIFAGAAFFWLAILFALTMSDYSARPWLTGGM